MTLALGVRSDSLLCYSIIIHSGNNISVQWEHLFVIPELASDYLQQNFQNKTPNVYLSGIAPVTWADHIIQAILPDSNVSQTLDIDQEEACLQIKRRT